MSRMPTSETAHIGGWVAAAKQPPLTATLRAENELLRAALRFYATGGCANGTLADGGARARSVLKPTPQDAPRFAVSGEYHAHLTAAQCEVLRSVFEASKARWTETDQVLEVGA